MQPKSYARRRDLGNRIRSLRLEQALSQEQLAELADLHRTYVGSVERGERNVSLDAIWQFADALNTTPVSFFEG